MTTTVHTKIEPRGERLKRRLSGVVVSDRMTKARVVAVTRLKQSPKYLKYFKVTTRFKAADPEDQYHTGDGVVIEETRPISKQIRWRIVAGTGTKKKAASDDAVLEKTS